MLPWYMYDINNVEKRSSIVTICLEESTEADTCLSLLKSLQKWLESDLAFLKECAYSLGGSVVSNASSIL